jgi:hypothetical protein
LLGELNLPIEILLTIEEDSSTPDELQKNMGIIDECGNPSRHYAWNLNHVNF